MANLFINACVREESRTIVVAKDIIKKLNLECVEVNLEKENIQPLTSKTLKHREELISKNNLSDNTFKFARQFAEAENIVIAAPYWDLSFPALLKAYLENICVLGITFDYENDFPKGLCKAKKLIYVTTAGGKIFADFGYGYVKALANSLLGIQDTVCFKAENMDVENISKDEVLSKAKIIEVK